MPLHVVATPIGNLEDITIRAVGVLKSVEAIIAEDTRTYRKLAGALNIPAKPVYSLYKGNESARVAQVLPKLQAGLSAALVSESGTPAVSDPGAMLVRKCLECGVPVIPVPGPSSLTAALSIAGVFGSPISFFGFLSKKLSLPDVIRSNAAGQTVVFFEHPRNLSRTLKTLADLSPRSRLVVGRELTKLHEEIWSGFAADGPAAFNRPVLKGEVVLVLEPTGDSADSAREAPGRMDEAIHALERLRDAQIPLSSAVRKISAEHDIPRGRLYQRALKLW